MYIIYSISYNVYIIYIIYIYMGFSSNGESPGSKTLQFCALFC